MDVNTIFEDINQKFNIRNSNRLTQFFIMTVAVIFSDLVWSWLDQVFKGKKSLIWVGVGSFIFLSLLGLNWLMFKKNILVLSVSFFTIFIAYLTIFGFTLENLVINLVAFLLFSYGSFRAISEKEARIRINIFKIVKTGMPMVLTGLSLTIATAYFFSPLTQQISTIDVPRPVFNIAIKPLMLKITEDGTAHGSAITIDPLVLEKYGITLKENYSEADMENAAYLLVNKQLNGIIEPFKEFYPLGFAIGLFFLLKSIGYLMMYLVMIFSWLIFRSLVSLGAIKINVEPAVKEVIEM